MKKPIRCEDIIYGIIFLFILTSASHNVLGEYLQNEELCVVELTENMDKELTFKEKYKPLDLSYKRMYIYPEKL
jgi:hypothetical protein